MKRANNQKKTGNNTNNCVNTSKGKVIPTTVLVVPEEYPDQARSKSDTDNECKVFHYELYNIITFEDRHQWGTLNIDRFDPSRELGGRGTLRLDRLESPIRVRHYKLSHMPVGAKNWGEGYIRSLELSSIRECATQKYTLGDFQPNLKYNYSNETH